MKKVKFCPKCKSINVMMPRGDNLLWQCKDCGYQANMFPEASEEELNRLNKKKK